MIDLEITSNVSLTKKRVKCIRQYMNEKVLNNSGFICSHYKNCKRSHPGNFYEGQLHYIGKNYDLIVNNKPLRIMFVGQEIGGIDRHITLEQRYMDQMELGKKNYREWNSHMRGTTRALGLLLGKNLDIDEENKWINFSNNKKCHIWDTFALVDYLLCSALGEDKRATGKSSTTMKNNCQEHFRKVLEILEPNVIIVQGKKFWKWVEKVFDSIKLLSRSDVLYNVKINDTSAICASFTHPSARDIRYNWGHYYPTDYFKKIVKPNILHIFKLMDIG
jgi:uracil-DNA glycosylase